MFGPEAIKPFLLKTIDTVLSNSIKGLSFGFFLIIIVKDKFVVLCLFPVVVNYEEKPFDWFAIVCEHCCFIIYTNFKGWWCYLLRLPVSHCVPLNPGAQLHLNPFTWSKQLPLFLQGWLAQSSISVVRGWVRKLNAVTFDWTCNINKKKTTNYNVRKLFVVFLRSLRQSKQFRKRWNSPNIWRKRTI